VPTLLATSCPPQIIRGSHHPSRQILFVVLVDVEDGLAAFGLFHTVAVTVIDEAGAAGNRYHPVFHIPANDLRTARGHIAVGIIRVTAGADCGDGMRFRAVGVSITVHRGDVAVHRAVRDVCFLMKLHHQVNSHFMTEERLWGVMFAALEGNLRAITRENTHQRLLSDLAGIYSRYIPYPLDVETAGTVRSAIRNHVITWDEFDGGDTLDEWFYNYLLDQGARELPQGVYKYDDEKWQPLVTADNEKEVRDCFQDDAEFERFKAGEDYIKGLATIKDADYGAHYGRMVKAIHKLVDSGQVQIGNSLYLETVPIPFLQVATLVEGEWLDRHVMMFAEVGAMLIDKSYQLQETSDHHPLAWLSFIDSSGSEINQSEIHVLSQQVSRRLKRFPGRTKEIDGQVYINFEDYCAWPGRKVKGDLHSNVFAGFITASWNNWLDSKGAKGRLAGVPVVRLQSYVEEHDYLVCPDGAEGQLKRRGFMLSMMCKTDRHIAKQEVVYWKEIAGVLFSNLHAFSQAVTTIRQRYFDGEEILFPNLMQSLADLTKYTEDLITEFNDHIAKEPEDKINMEALQQDTDKVVAERISYLVDLSKAEALDAMGDNRAAVELIERYLL